jgi:ABC-2 type transport system permease protein
VKPLNFTRITQSFKTKNFKYGGYSTLLFLIVLVILIVVNLIADQLPVKFDLSENQMYSLSDQTVKIVKNLRQPVTIYSLTPASQGNQSLTEILKKYRDYSSQISLKTVDPNKNPGFIKQFTEDGVTPEQGALVVVSGKKHKLIQAGDLVNYSTNEQTGEPQAHGEIELASTVESQLRNANYAVKSVSLITQVIPSDAAVIIINAPQQDITAAEADQLRQFLAKGGRLIYLADYTAKELINLNALLGSYGVAIQHQIVVEGDSSQHLPNNPLFLLPTLAEHQILKSLHTSKTPVLFPGAQSIKTLDLKKDTTAIEPLLTTSASAWAKVNVNSLNDQKASSDPTGPFQIAVAISDQPASGGAGTKLIVTGSAQFLNPQFTAQIPGNLSFLTNSLSWLLGRKDTLSIQPKSLLSYSLRLNETQALLYIGLVVIVIPVGIMIAGLLVWLRRRHS